MGFLTGFMVFSHGALWGHAPTDENHPCGVECLAVGMVLGYVALDGYLEVRG